MKYSDKNPPLCCMQTQSRCYRLTNKMTIRGILWHDTAGGNPYIHRYVQPSDNAKDKDYWLKLLGVNQYHNDWNHVERSAGLNCWVGKLADGTVTTVQSMPWDFAPWGCGGGSKGSCNDGWVQFEICDDGYISKDYFNEAYKEACEITAYLCKKFNINPKGTVKYNGVTVPTILCHYDSYKLGLGGNHGDVYGWFNKFGKTMDDVRNDVAKLLYDGTYQGEFPVLPYTGIEVGDLVTITGTKYYDSTKAIPTWAKGERWFVQGVTSNYVVLGKNETKTNELNSRLAINDVKLVNPKVGYYQKGDRNEEVKKMQSFLLWFGTKQFKKADGIFGDKTFEAVKEFQKKVGVGQDGKFGKKTLAAAKAYKK